MLTMRFLLTFHSGVANQWRCLDTAHLPAFRSGRTEDLPAALRAAPDLVMRWLLGRYEIADALVPVIEIANWAPGQDGLIAVYALDPGQSVVGLEQEYHGAWLEIFLQENRPLGFIVARKVQAAPTAEMMASLAERAAHPLHASNSACRETVDRITEHQHVLGELREGGASGSMPLSEKA